jgi:benzoate membrane transport protein
MFQARSIAANPAAGGKRLPAVLADVNSANIAAGITTGLFYAFGAMPVHVDSVSSLRLDPGAASSWFFITFMTSAISSLVLSIKYRMPLPIGWSMPGLIFLASSAGHYSHAEMAGASLIAGIAIVVLGLLGIGERLMRWMPLPIVMGMFAGNVLGYVTSVFRQIELQPVVVGATILGYLGAKAYGRVWCPPMADSVFAGIGTAIALGRVDGSSFTWNAPVARPMLPAFDPGSMLALALPLVVMAIGMGNVQGFGILSANGFRPPVRLVSVWMGVTTILNAIFGGHISALQSGGVALLAGEEAGRKEQRYVASTIAAILAIPIGLCAATVGALVGVLPPGLVPAIAGLALLTSLADAMRKTMVSELPIGALFALLIASSGISILGLGGAFWALIGGLVASLIAERPAIRASWRTALS